MTEIPIIDLKEITIGGNESPQEWKRVAGEIRRALHEVGFMYLSNHGVPEALIAENFEISRQFFELPLDTKKRYKKDLKKGRYGWVEPGQELLHEDSKFEYRECFDITTKKRIFPTEIASFSSTHKLLELHCSKLIKIVLKLLATSLEISDIDYFIKRCCHLNEPDVENECEFSMIYYPPISPDNNLPTGTVRCAEHTDYEIMTFLFQNQVGGLEIKNAKGEWISADPIPNTILVNTGDLLEMWTRKFYKATLHRVTIPKTEEERQRARYSFAYFIAPDNETLIAPFTSPVISQYLEQQGKSTMEHWNGEAFQGAESKDTPISAYDHIIKRVYTAYGVNK